MLNAISLNVDPISLRPLIESIVAETLAQTHAEQGKLADRLAFGEAEAASLIGLRPHQLRDERLRGRIRASTGPGKKILYTRKDLLDYLSARRIG